MSSPQTYPLRLTEILANAASHSVARERPALTRHIAQSLTEQLVALATESLRRQHGRRGDGRMPVEELS